jgi:hypothetical protein
MKEDLVIKTLDKQNYFTSKQDFLEMK